MNMRTINSDMQTRYHTASADFLQEHVVLAGFRFGDKGTHTSRTIMFSELHDLLAAVPGDAVREDFKAAIIDENVLGKETVATRRITRQRLVELYGLDPTIPLFRVLRRLWEADEKERRLLAMMCALARDPLLLATRDSVLSLPAGAELVRTQFVDEIRQAVGSRLNESVLDKVARNAASSWTQSGHLKGRVRKIRQKVMPTPSTVAMALWLGTVEGQAGPALLDTQWTRLLDRTGPSLLGVAKQAKQRGLIHLRAGGGITEIDARELDPFTSRR